MANLSLASYFREVQQLLFGAYFHSRCTSVTVWGAFTGFDKCPLVIMLANRRIIYDFVEIVYEGALTRDLTNYEKRKIHNYIYYLGGPARCSSLK